MTNRPKALVLGATGGIGGEVARRLHGRGWRVRALARDAASAASRAPAFEWLQGDAMRRGDVVAAAEGARLVVHAVNPPGYRDWDRLVLPMLDNTIDAARAVGARILLPGTVYNYGPEAFPLIAEGAPQNPATRKGAVRAEMERRLRAASEDGVRVLIVRAGDFFGPQARNSWFSQGMVEPGKPLRRILYPGAPGVGHQWAYLPDVAETMVRLLEREAELGAFETFHMDGHWDADGRRMTRAIAAAAGKPQLKARPFPWMAARLASPFVPLFRELLEMRYLWRRPVRLDNSRLLSVLGAEPRTPLDLAVSETLTGLGCLSQDPGTAVRPRPA